MQNLLTIALNLISKEFKTFNGHETILQDISITFTQGDSYAIQGKSGSGKSTLLHIIAGLDTPTGGSVTYRLQNDTPSAINPPPRFGLVFQKPYLIKELSIIENILLPQLIAGIPEKQAHEHAMHLIEAIGLLAKAHIPVPALSGGQQQRVAVARALSTYPPFIIADEPTGNLDPETGQAIIDLLCVYQKKYSIGIILNTHDRSIAEQMAHRYVIENGALRPYDIAAHYCPLIRKNLPTIAP